MKKTTDKKALVGFSTNDDAAVYRLNAKEALVETVDFFPPVVDDPYAFGAIAAANALSDIYAMGARPLFALNLACFPTELPLATLSQILKGGADKAEEAGIAILGGHTIRDPEPKYGLAVTGLVHPQRILTNSGAKPGDLLLLTKPIGSGIATTAIKRKKASRELELRVTELMSRLNRSAGEVFASGRFKVNALTDVTGYGLLGHLLEMMRGAKTRATLHLERVPLLSGIAALAEDGVIPGGTRDNLAHVAKAVKFPKGLPDAIKLVLADAQTNGGLLAAVPEKDVLKALRALERKGVDVAVIGEVVEGRPGVIVV